MKRTLFLCIIAVSIVLGNAKITQAQAFRAARNHLQSNEIDTSTRMGLGYDVDLNGLTFRIGQIDEVRFDISLGLGVDFTAKSGDVNFDVTPGFRVLFPLKRYKSLVIQAIAGVYLMLKPTSNNFTMNISLFGGLAPELFLLPNLSIEMIFGLSVGLNDITDNFSLNVGTIGKGISIVSGAAFHWYF